MLDLIAAETSMLCDHHKAANERGINAYVFAADDLVINAAIAFYNPKTFGTAFIRTSPLILSKINDRDNAASIVSSRTEISFSSDYKEHIDKVITFFRRNLGDFEEDTIVTISSGYLSSHLIEVMEYLKLRGLKIGYLSVNDAVLEPCDDGMRISFDPNILEWNFETNLLVLKNSQAFAIPKKLAINSVDGSLASKFEWTLRFSSE